MTIERQESLLGRQLGSYRIDSLLGAGGMGQVYRAHDSRLGRDVAIKILPPDVANDRDRLARFEREARMLASLSHPNIAGIYGIEETTAGLALILELVEGETLAERLEPGPLSIADAVDIARQIVTALEVAHDKGIVHRDLKPANIKITPAGVVKVLDFGLAKAVCSPAIDAAELPTATIAGTLEGAIVGTAAYMSPEQARGRPVDKRTDIWAFGCVLFEMLSGRKPFGGDTVMDVLAAILEREPDWSLIPPYEPFPRLLGRCLEKDQQLRLSDIREARFEFTQVLLSSGSQIDRPAPRSTSRTTRSFRLSPAAAAVIVLVPALVVGAVYARLRGARSRATPEAPVQITDFNDSVVMPSLSHDGRMLTFIRGVDFGRTAPTLGQVYVKLLPNGEPVQLTHGEGGGFPTFSADDSRIVYTVVMPGLKWDSWEVPVLGGSPQPFLPNASGLVWLDRQRLVYSSIESGNHMGIVTSSVSRTEPRNVYFPSSTGGMAHRSSPSPDEASLLVVEMDRGTWQPCRLVPLDGSSPGRPVGPLRGQCTSAAWSPDGRWMYFSSNAGGGFHIWRQRHPDGEPEQITFGPTQQEGTAITPDGRHLITSMGLERAAIFRHDDSGERRLTEEGYAMRPAMAPSGSRLFYLMRTDGSQGQASGELWTLDLTTGNRQSLFPGLIMTYYALSQDGQNVVFTSSGHDGGDGVWIADLDRRSPPRQLTRKNETRALFGAPGEIVYMGDDGHLYRMRQDGSGSELVSPDPIVYLMTVSPDGRWAAVINPESGAGGGTSAEFRSLKGGKSFPICNAKCTLGPRSILAALPFNWTPDGKALFVNLNLFGGGVRRTVVLPYRSDAPIETLWPNGLTTEKNVAANPGARILDGINTFPGADAAEYLVWKSSFQSNLYRVRIPD